MVRRSALLAIVLVSSIAIFGRTVKPVHAWYDPGPWSCSASGSSNEIEGCVYRPDGIAIPGVPVYIISTGFYIENSTVTDSNGHFVFQTNSCPQSGPNCVVINPGVSYPITINGHENTLGVTPDNPNHGQWGVVVQTNSYAYAYVQAMLEYTNEVLVPTASLFSNTKYATYPGLYYTYQTQHSYSFDHTLSFGIDNVGVGLGYTTTTTIADSSTYGVLGNVQTVIGEYWYVTSYWCNGGGTALDGWGCGSARLVSVGPFQPAPGATLATYPTSEYINPSQLQAGSYTECIIIPGAYCANSNLVRSSSYTWHLDLLNVQGNFPDFYGVYVKLTVSLSVTSGTSEYLGYSIYNNTTSSLEFRAYYSGNGMELHVWDISGAG